MNKSEHDRNHLEHLLERMSNELKCSPDELKHELSELLAGVDRDVGRLRDTKSDDNQIFASLSDQLLELTTRLKSRLPKLSKIAQELMEHLTRMGF